MARLVTKCAVEDCTSLTGVPGTAKGFCGSHYRRQKLYGDPLASGLRGRTYCTIEGCEKPCAGRGLCKAHWYHWKTYGDPTRRIRGRVVGGKRICSRCRIDKPLGEFGNDRNRATGYSTYCKDCLRLNAAEWRAAHPDYVQPQRDLEQARLFAKAYRVRHPEYHPSYRDRTREHARQVAKRWRRRNPEAVKTHATARRTRRRNAYVEPVPPSAVYERDGWICGICDAAIDPALTAPDPMSASVDHIIPLSRHGKHAMANVQAAHLVCNMRKGAKIVEMANGTQG